MGDTALFQSPFAHGIGFQHRAQLEPRTRQRQCQGDEKRLGAAHGCSRHYGKDFQRRGSCFETGQEYDGGSKLGNHLPIALRGSTSDFMVYASVLENRAVIAVNGAEARDFLQGLITNDMGACREGHAIYAGLLTPQGKILFDFFVVANGEKSWLIGCAGSRPGDLVKRPTLYRLRAEG